MQSVYWAFQNLICSQQSTIQHSFFMAPLIFRIRSSPSFVLSGHPSIRRRVTHGRRSSKTGRTSFICSDFPSPLTHSSIQRPVGYILVAYVFLCANPLCYPTIWRTDPQNQKQNTNHGSTHFQRHKQQSALQIFGSDFCSTNRIPHTVIDSTKPDGRG